MKNDLNFEKQIKQLLKSKLDSQYVEDLPFATTDPTLNYMNAVCLSLVGKAVKGDIQAIKYINEICNKEAEVAKDTPLSITIKVVE